MHVSLQCHTFNEFGQEVSSSLGFLHPVPLHDLSVPVDADVPRPSWLGLSVQDGRVGHVVVLKHTLFELTLRREVFLKYTHTKKRETAPTSGQSSLRTVSLFRRSGCPFFFFMCHYLYIYSTILQGTAGNGRKWAQHFIVTGSVCRCIKKQPRNTHVCVHEDTHRGASIYYVQNRVVPEFRCHNSAGSVYL